MTVDDPVRLIAALAAGAALALLYRFLAKRDATQALLYSNLAFMRAAAGTGRTVAIALGLLWAIAVLALGFAVSGTRIITRVPAPDGAAVICIDTSGSMGSTDIFPSRQAAARNAVRAFVEAAPPGLRIGIVSFSSSANVVAPLTADRDELGEAIDRIPAANGATAIGDALLAADGLLPTHGRRIVVLLTDGVNNRGSDPLEAAATLASHGVPIETVGIGTNESGKLVPGTEEEASIDEDALRAIAAAGGGHYVKVGESEALRNVFAQLAQGTVWVRKPIDASLPLALGGSLVLIVAFFTGFAAGKFP
jgi:Ca-activated chloride channel homolog